MPTAKFTGRDCEERTRQDVRTRTEDGYTSSSTVTGRNGGTATREKTVVRDPEAGTRSVDVDWVGPDRSFAPAAPNGRPGRSA